MTIEKTATKKTVSDQTVHKRYIKQLMQIVMKKLKFLLCPVVTDLCTARNATKNINPRDINLKRTHT